MTRVKEKLVVLLYKNGKRETVSNTHSSVSVVSHNTILSVNEHLSSRRTKVFFLLIYR